MQPPPDLLSKRLYSHAHDRVWREHQRGHPAEDVSPDRPHGRFGGRRRRKRLRVAVDDERGTPVGLGFRGQGLKFRVQV